MLNENELVLTGGGTNIKCDSKKNRFNDDLIFMDGSENIDLSYLKEQILSKIYEKT